MKPIKIALISLMFIFILFISVINNKNTSLTDLNNSNVYYENLPEAAALSLSGILGNGGYICIRMFLWINAAICRGCRKK